MVAPKEPISVTMLLAGAVPAQFVPTVKSPLVAPLQTIVAARPRVAKKRRATTKKSHAERAAKSGLVGRVVFGGWVTGRARAMRIGIYI